MGQVGGASKGLTIAVVLAVGIAVYWLWALYSGKIDTSTLTQLRIELAATLLVICLAIVICVIIAICVVAGVHFAIIDAFIATCVTIVICNFIFVFAVHVTVGIHFVTFDICVIIHFCIISIAGCVFVYKLQSPSSTCKNTGASNS